MTKQCTQPSTAFDANLLYDPLHCLPFLTDYLTYLPRGTKIAYFGGNIRLLELLRDFVQQSWFGGELLLAAEPLGIFDASLPSSGSHVLRTLSSQECAAKADLFIFDFSMSHSNFVPGGLESNLCARSGMVA